MDVPFICEVSVFLQRKHPGNFQSFRGLRFNTMGDGKGTAAIQRGEDDFDYRVPTVF